MKNILITLLLTLFSLTTYSQEIVKPTCIDIKHPVTYKVIGVVCDSNLEERLNELKKEYNIDTVLLEMFINGKAYSCKYEKQKVTLISI